MAKYKILLSNTQYFRGLDGSNIDAFLHLLRYVFLCRIVELKYIEKFKKIIKKVNPDLICLIEIEGQKQLANFIDSNYRFSYIEKKYGVSSVLRKLPLWRNKSNAVISKKSLKTRVHFLKNGVKKMLYEVELPNKQKTKLFLFHFSLKKNVRKKQFVEILKIIKSFDSKILCGDFNIYNGVLELDYILNNSSLNFMKASSSNLTSFTYPSFKPKYDLDLFLCTDDVVGNVSVLNSDFSDHLPVVLEID